MHGIAAKDGGLLLSTVRNLFVSSCFARAYLRQIHLLIIREATCLRQLRLSDELR